jgi:hypothetical protein
MTYGYARQEKRVLRKSPEIREEILRKLVKSLPKLIDMGNSF